MRLTATDRKLLRLFTADPGLRRAVRRGMHPAVYTAIRDMAYGLVSDAEQDAATLAQIAALGREVRR